MAAFLTFVVTGLSHIYVRRVGRGLTFLFFGLVVSVFGVIAAGLWGGALIVLALRVTVAYDAYRETERYNRHIDRHGEEPW